MLPGEQQSALEFLGLDRDLRGCEASEWAWLSALHSLPPLPAPLLLGTGPSGEVPVAPGNAEHRAGTPPTQKLPWAAPQPCQAPFWFLGSSASIENTLTGSNKGLALGGQ